MNEEKIIGSMFQTCTTKEECMKWLGVRIQDSYSRAELYKSHGNSLSSRICYQEVSTYSRIQFYIDSHLQSLRRSS